MITSIDDLRRVIDRLDAIDDGISKLKGLEPPKSYRLPGWDVGKDLDRFASAATKLVGAQQGSDQDVPEWKLIDALVQEAYGKAKST